MKIVILSLMAAASLMLTSCVVVPSNQTLAKETVFGLSIAPSTGGSTLNQLTYSVKFGLIRYEFLSNPTSTNPVYAAPITSGVNASLTPLHQTATETISTK